MQKGVRARTEGGDELKGLGNDQQNIAADTGKLGGDISKTDGDKTPESDKPPKSGDKDQPKSDEKEKPKSDDKQKPKSRRQRQAKVRRQTKAGQRRPKPGESVETRRLARSPATNPNRASRPTAANPTLEIKTRRRPALRRQTLQAKQFASFRLAASQGKPGSPSDDENSDQQQKPPQPQEPADRAAKKLREAQQRMEEATKKIEESIRKGATEQQLQAIKDLELAKAELERILRQLREEELERTLTQLAARFRKMLELQTAVYDGTVKLDHVPEAQRTHDHEIESARLSRQESQIVDEVDKALLLLHEDGSSVAFPEAIEQMRDDMRQVTDRLAALKVEKVTQGIEKDIIAALEETIAAFEQSRKDLEKKKTPPGQQPSAGQPDDMSLVEKIAELKMIRSLQMRINNRTKTYGEMIQGDQAETPDLLKALDGLADRQQRVYKAAADLQQRPQQE